MVKRKKKKKKQTVVKGGVVMEQFPGVGKRRLCLVYKSRVWPFLQYEGGDGGWQEVR